MYDNIEPIEVTQGTTLEYEYVLIDDKQDGTPVEIYELGTDESLLLTIRETLSSPVIIEKVLTDGKLHLTKEETELLKAPDTYVFSIKHMTGLGERIYPLINVGKIIAKEAV